MVTDEFRRIGIQFIPLKGPLLSQRIYGDATFRRYHDLDILIDLKDFSIVYDYLLQKGYQPDLILPNDEKSKQSQYNYAKHVLFIHRQTKVIIEIHWKIFDEMKSFNLDFDSLLAHTTTNQVFMNREFRILNKEYDLLYLLLHGSIHRWNRLKWLIDINDYLKCIGCDRLKIINLAQKYKVATIIPLYNSIAEIYLPEPELFDSKLKTPNLLVQICKRKITDKQVLLTKLDPLSSLKDYTYGLLIFSDFGNRIAFLKTRFILFSDSRAIKSANPLLLMLYRPFGYFYRHRPGRS